MHTLDAPHALAVSKFTKPMGPEKSDISQIIFGISHYYFTTDIMAGKKRNPTSNCYRLIKLNSV